MRLWVQFTLGGMICMPLLLAWAYLELPPLWRKWRRRRNKIKRHNLYWATRNLRGSDFK